eukprot:snap_masked-scaffold_46-processed-gene-1.63-mRNA-1 protein AED:1.00 eAED:1.00 QI:0/-1/0/0/-1/1/1/0/72
MNASIHFISKTGASCHHEELEIRFNLNINDLRGIPETSFEPHSTRRPDIECYRSSITIKYLEEALPGSTVLQ